MDGQDDNRWRRGRGSLTNFFNIINAISSFRVCALNFVNKIEQFGFKVICLYNDGLDFAVQKG